MDKNRTAAAWSDYMEQLAVMNTDISHTEDEKHFFRGELEEFFVGLRNHVNFPAIIQEGWTGGINNSDEVFSKRRETSFIVVQEYEELTDFDAIEEAYESCELIGDEFIRKIIADSEDLRFEFETIEILKLQNEQERYVGVRYTIEIKSCFDIEPNEDKWSHE